MPRRGSTLVAMAVVLAVVGAGLGAVLLTLGAPWSGERVYLALGDSLTAGFQGSTGDAKGSAYPALLAARLGEDGVELRVENLACTGESTPAMVGGGRCFPPPDSQLREAERVIAAEEGRIALVTVLIGANDILRCVMTGGAVDESCLTSGLGDTAEGLPVVLGRLRTALGPDVPIVALTFYDPFRATISGRPVPPGTSAGSARATEALNDVIREAAAGADVTVVDIRPAMEGAEGTALCTTTSICRTGDFHLNAAGHAAIADLLHDRLAPRVGAAARAGSAGRVVGAL